MTDRRAEQFVALYARHEQSLFRFVASLVPVRADAEDIVQDTASVLWQKFPEYDASRPFLPWAFGVARLEVLNYLRKKKLGDQVLSPALVEELAKHRQGMDDQLAAEVAALAQCLNKLPAGERSLLEQRYRDPETLVAHAETLNCKVNALYKRLGRIRSKVADCIRFTLLKEGWQ